MSSPFTVPPSEPDPATVKRLQQRMMMRAIIFFLCASAIVILILPLPLPLALRALVSATDLIAALVVYAIYRQRMKAQ
jgi:hypothetical protein